MTRNRRPRIGISGPDAGGYPAWLAASWAVRVAGGRPVRVRPRSGLPEEPLDGLIVGGGADVDPSHYGEHRSEAPPVEEEMRGRSLRSRLRALAGYVVSPFFYLIRRLFAVKLGGLDEGRDALEMALLERAHERGAPVLGICRGAQLMNVFRGGSLHQDLTSFYTESPNPWTVFPRKTVNVEANSSLARALGRTRCRVNSLHRQAVDQLGDGLHAVGIEETGVVQAIEAAGERFFVGVQWHPEYLPQRWEQRRLFSVFVDHARRCATQRSSGSVVEGAQELGSDLPVT